jgi:hypothetical protein
LLDGLHDKGYIGGRANKVNIVNAHSLKDKKNFRELIDGDALSQTFMADLEILAIDTPEVTRREEYISRTTRPRDRWLFSIVGTIMGNKYFIGNAAIAFLASKPVGQA